ncbi:MAG: DNA polymerase III subunit [Planctomycetota bacterium]
MSFFDVRYQPRAQKILQRALASGRLPHAYLFHGPDGVGKEMLAERLARILLCEKPVYLPAPPIEELAGFDGPLRDACGACQDCVLARAGTHPDLHLIYRELHKHHPEPRIRAQKGLELGVEVVRHFVIEAVGTKPARGRAKVFIIREAERINIEAQNALLKTIEEPPAATFLVLLSASLDKLLATTKSRCQPVPFAPLPPVFVAAKLTEFAPDITPERAAAYAALAQGSLGRAQQFCADVVEAYNERIIAALSRLGAVSVTHVAKQWLDDAATLGEQYRSREKEISETEAQRRGLKTLFALVAAWFGDSLHVSVNAPDGLVNAGDLRRLTAAGLGPRQAALAIKAVVDAERHLDRNASPQLAVEALVTRLARLAPASRAS